MAYPNDLARTKNWGNEVLMDADIEGQLDLIITWLMAFADATTGHKHDATANEGPKIATGGLDLSTITQALVMTSKILNQAKGADVASAAGNIALGDDGNYFDITGTDAITSITIKQAGTVVTLQFDSTASLVDGGNLKLNGNFQGAAESQITLISDGTNWFEVSRTPTDDGKIVQIVNKQMTTEVTSANVLVDDNTIPQLNETTAVDTLAITPTSAVNKLLIRITAVGKVGNTTAILLLFDEASTDCLRLVPASVTSNTNCMTSLEYYMTAGVTTEKTFYVRIATVNSNGTWVINEQQIVTNGYGGVVGSSITITEIKA